MPCPAAIPRRIPGPAATILVVVGLACAGGAAGADPGLPGGGRGTPARGATDEAAYRISAAFGVRVPTGYFGASPVGGGTTRGEDQTGGGIGLLGDYLTGHGGLRLSGGAIVGGIGDVGGGHAGDDPDRAGIVPTAVVPALAVGYDAEVGQRWALSADLGALYTGGLDRAGLVAHAVIDADRGQHRTDAPDFHPYLRFTVAFRF